MKKTTIAIFSVMVMLMLAACNGGSYKRTKSGLMYKIISDGKSPKTKKGQVLKFDFVQKLRDSVLFSSADNGHGYIVVDSAVVADYNPNEIFPLLRKGDSAVVIYEADTIRKKSGQLPPFLKPKDKIFLHLKVVNVFNTEEEANKDRDLSQAEFQKKQEAKDEEQKQKEIVVLRDYLKSKGVTAQSAPKGTLVEITTPGDGPAVDSGKFVSVMYTGQTMAGVVFDSSIDPKFQHPGQPYTFQIGSIPPGAIEGWNDGLRLFKKGGKGRLYIPSVLGYGKRGNGNDIKPNENLIFDVEIVNVSDTNPTPAPGPGGAPNR